MAAILRADVRPPNVKGRQQKSCVRPVKKYRLCFGEGQGLPSGDTPEGARRGGHNAAASHEKHSNTHQYPERRVDIERHLFFSLAPLRGPIEHRQPLSDDHGRIGLIRSAHNG
jgi:hypothetical protein